MAKVLIAAGGTGGHIYPALAIADAFKAHPELTVEFVGTAHGLENRIIPPKGYKVHHLPVGRLNSNVPLSERLKTVLLLPWAFVKSAFLLRRERPVFVLGVGGHASGPLLLMASLLRYRSAIWEPNAMPGLANRILSRYVDECWVVFDEARRHLRGGKMHLAGMPVRKEIENTALALRPSEKFRLLIFGGSQGARGINNTTVEMIKADPAWARGFKIVHQTGPVDYARIKEAYGGLLQSHDIDLREYLHDMGDQYAAADLVVCRSGTGTLSELAACGKAAVLIPFPFASDDHQRKNAESLVSKGAAQMIIQKDLSPRSLRGEIDRLRNHPEELKRMAQEIRSFHHPRAAETLVEEFVERIQSDASS
ncbi:MAG: undecaprenyldiphospho-muramoylpentapeptide beta-N-acetylglucosaminyltransferase [Bdellovibrionales bacterium]|nr:undecaprenyldiphospho-muramoylpentapeptide beta-N-acetylglucosaminyltransferase [Bdellovibrionales bacterium]